MEETDRYPDLDMTDGILRLLCNQMLDAINKLPEERLSEIDFDTLSKNAVALTRAVAYKKNVDTKTRDLLENGAEQFKDLIARETLATSFEVKEGAELAVEVAKA